MSRTGTSRTDLPDDVQRGVRAAFAHVSEMLEEAERALTAAQRSSSTSSPETTPAQLKAFDDAAALARKTMTAALRRWKMAPSASPPSAVRTARSMLRSAGIAIAELAPRHAERKEAPEGRLRELSLVSGALTDLLDDMDSYLARGGTGSVIDRMPHLAPSDGVQQELAELERTIRKHGLIRLQAGYESIVERLASELLEIVFFGRVNCGKSSLVNYIVGRDILPVGVTPVTAVQTRLVHGKKVEGTVSFIDAQAETFDLGRLAEFANMRQNPGNLRHVERLQIALPEPLLDGVSLVDTPGLGSLSQEAAAEALACLPRCDLGVLLIDSTSTFTPEDAALTEALTRSGAEVMVLLTKADLLGRDDLVAAESYIQGELNAAAGVQLAVHPVSVKVSAFVDRWLDDVLRPCLQDRRRLRDASTARKVNALRTEVIAGLERRAQAAQVRSVHAREHGGDGIGDGLRRALADFDRLRPMSEAALGDPAAAAVDVLAQAAHNAAVIWHEEPERDFDASAIVVASLAGRAAATTTAIKRDVGLSRARLATALAAAARAAPGALADAEDLARPAAPPLLDAAASVPQITVRRPSILPPLRTVLASHLRSEFERAGLRRRVAAALERHDRLLQAWRTQMLDMLRIEFIVLADRFGIGLEGAEDPSSAPGGVAPDATPRTADLP